MGTLQENQSLNAEYERNKRGREMKQEIERLKEENELLKSNPNFVYAMRNNKAIEYIEKHTNRLVEYLDVFEVHDLVNILQGVDKE